MTLIHSRLTVVIFNLINISAFTNTAEFADDHDLHDVTCFGAARKAYAAGLGDGTFTMGGIHDDGVLGPRNVIKPIMSAGTLVSLAYRPEGTGSGKAQSAVNILVKSYVDTSAVAAMFMWKSVCQMSGDLVETAQP